MATAFDSWRASFEGAIVPSAEAGCYAPVLPPMAISASAGGADLRVETGA